MSEADVKKNKLSLKSEAEKRIKTGLFLSAFGDEKKIQVNDQEINNELRKQMGMMPGQEKIIQEYYQKNPAALNSLRGSIYEEKIIEEIKKECKSNKKEITKEQAEKILKEENEKNLKAQLSNDVAEKNTKTSEKKPKKAPIKKKAKKVSKK